MRVRVKVLKYTSSCYQPYSSPSIVVGVVCHRACVQGGLGGVAASAGGGAVEGISVPLPPLLLGPGTGLQSSCKVVINFLLLSLFPSVISLRKLPNLSCRI